MNSTSGARPGVVQSADEVRGEDEAAFQNGDDEQVVDSRTGGDLGRQFAHCGP